MKKQWYAVSVRSGSETIISQTISRNAKRHGLGRQMGRVLVPTEKTRRMRGNSQKWYVDERNKFAGYMFVEMAVTPDTHHLLHDIDGVFGLLPTSEDPHTLQDHEVSMLLAECKDARAKGKSVRAIFPYGIDDVVKVTQGPFRGTTGTVVDIDEERPGADPDITIEVTILGQPTKITLKFFQLVQI